MNSNYRVFLSFKLQSLFYLDSNFLDLLIIDLFIEFEEYLVKEGLFDLNGE